MCTGGGSLLNGRWRGSTTLTPSGDGNHNLPSVDLVDGGKWPAATPRLLTPSELSKTVAWTVGFVRLAVSTAVIQASSSDRGMRTSPQGMSTQNERSSSSRTQWAASQGSPLPLVSVARRPSFNRLSPPSVAIQRAPSGSRRRALTRPVPSPSSAVYDGPTRPSAKWTRPPSTNPTHTPSRHASPTRAVAASLCPRLVHGICWTPPRADKRKSPWSWLATHTFPPASSAIARTFPPGTPLIDTNLSFSRVPIPPPVDTQIRPRSSWKRE